MQRANWLKRKLEREPRLLEGYKAFWKTLCLRIKHVKFTLIRITSNKAELDT